MEVVNARQGALTCFEVLNLLNEIKSSGSKQRNQKSYSTLLYASKKYLKSRPASVQTKEGIENLMRALKPFKLTPAEILQIIDLRPTTSAILSLIIEESEARLTSEQEQQILELVVKHLPEPEPIGVEVDIAEHRKYLNA
uniref:DNA-directed RNA polymerase III subunit RPC9 n=1 Tax=Steinernema glaseri TaxID=37863 RepID=A0A1I7YMH0_9BILA